MTRRRWLWLGLAGVAALALALAAYLVLSGRDARVKLTLVPGRSVWEHARTIDQAFPGRGEAVLARVSDEGWARARGLAIGARGPRGDGVATTWLEGYLFPETYFFPPDATAEDVVMRATRQFQKVLGELERSHASAFAALRELGLDTAAVVTLASLVEEETARKDEAPRIAGVFLNRLRRGMRLETDPTLMYRPDRVGRKPTRAERKDASNPYNTYSILGLPPGPICSPGRGALLAVLEAEAHELLFFVAKRDGTGASAFAATLEEHEANIDRYLRPAANPPKP